MKTALVLDPRDHWLVDTWIDNSVDVHVVDPILYLNESFDGPARSIRICNLSRSYQYQSSGYYVSLLAEARGHRVQPGVMTITDLAQSSRTGEERRVSEAIGGYRHGESLDRLIEKSLAPLTSKTFTLSIYFGENLAKRYRKLSLAIASRIEAPFIRCTFARGTRWRLQNVSAISVDNIPRNHREFVSQAASRYFSRRQVSSQKVRPPKYDLAILHNPDEGDLAPSCPTALKRLLKAAAKEDVRAELITEIDASRLLEFDALFLRETTAVNHHTYRLARRAEANRMVVIDDPMSILRCTNKVYLAELLARHDLSCPPTTILHRDEFSNSNEWVMGQSFPCVIKRPDSAFSQGVKLANDESEMRSLLSEFFKDSDLVIVQPFMKTDFDWRIGLIDGEPLFACKYHMARGHWQIAKHSDTGAKTRFGKCETLPVHTVPKKCLSLAAKSANLIGDGFYGVDVKQCGKEFFVIEINDNPNLDAGIEDQVLGEEVYRRIVRSFVRRLS